MGDIKKKTIANAPANEPPAKNDAPELKNGERPRNAGGASEAKLESVPAAPSSGGWFDQSVVEGTTRDKADAEHVDRLQRKPMPFSLPSEFGFTGVVGHSTASQSFTLDNSEQNPNRVTLAIVGKDASAFAIDSAASVLVPGKASESAEMPEIDVRFVPTQIGTAEAVLLINHDNGQQHITLRGTAAQGDGKASAKDGELPGVSRLHEFDPSQPKAVAGQLREASRHVAEVGERFHAVAPRVKAALAALNANSITAATTLQSRIIKWLTDEGISSAGAVEGGDPIKTGVDIGKKALEKIVEHGKEALPGLSIPIAAANWVADKAIEFAMDHHEEHVADQKREDDVGHAELAGAHARSADPMLKGILGQFGSLGNALSYRSGRADEIVGQVAQRIDELTKSIANAESGHTDNLAPDYARADKLVREYEQNEVGLREALANVETFATSVVPRTDAAFGQLLDLYAVERHKQASANDRDKRKFVLQVSGSFDLDQEPPVQLGAMEIEGLSEASATMKEHFAGKRLTELPLGCDAIFTLTGLPYGTIVYEWGTITQILYHHVPPVTGLWPEFTKLGGVERLKSALLDKKLGEGAA